MPFLSGFGYSFINGKDAMMKNLIDKINKKDISFLVALALFAAVVVIRFFDYALTYHFTLFSIMQNFKFALLVTIGYFAILFLMFLVCIAYCDVSQKRNMYYLIAFLSIFAFTMFLPWPYFGTTDVYAWLLTFLIGTLIVVEKMEWLTIPLSALITVLSPASIFICSCIVVVLFLYKYFANEEVKYLIYALLNGVASVLGIAIVVVTSSIELDIQNELSFKSFFAILVMLSPYLYIALSFMAGVFKRLNESKTKGFLFIILGAIPSVVINLNIKDYTRALYYVFFYFISIIMFLVAMKDEDISTQLEVTKKKLADYIPIPAILIAYPLVIITMWISGIQPLLEETLLGS